MIDSINKRIEDSINLLSCGEVIVPSDFKDYGTSTAIRKTLSRMVELGKIDRIAKGIYLKPIYDDDFGKIMPSIEKIANEIATKEHIIIRPSGVYALNKIGLSDQVPTNYVYLTNGGLKKINIGKTKLVFKPTTNKKLAMKGEITSLLFLGLEEINVAMLSNNDKSIIQQLLNAENSFNLRHDLKLTSSKISDFIINNFLTLKNGGMAY